MNFHRAFFLGTGDPRITLSRLGLEASDGPLGSGTQRVTHSDGPDLGHLHFHRVICLAPCAPVRDILTALFGLGFDISVRLIGPGSEDRAAEK